MNEVNYQSDKDYIPITAEEIEAVRRALNKMRGDKQTYLTRGDENNGKT